VTRIHKALFLVAGFGVAVCGAISVKSAVDLRGAERELRSIISANEFLKKTLGEMTVAMAAKDRQIDRLERAGCAGQDKVPPAAPKSAPRNKASSFGAVGLGNGVGTTAAEGESK
jgi:hypothetical protein